MLLFGSSFMFCWFLLVFSLPVAAGDRHLSSVLGKSGGEWIYINAQGTEEKAKAGCPELSLR